MEANLNSPPSGQDQKDPTITNDEEEVFLPIMNPSYVKQMHPSASNLQTPKSEAPASQASQRLLLPTPSSVSSPLLGFNSLLSRNIVAAANPSSSFDKGGIMGGIPPDFFLSSNNLFRPPRNRKPNYSDREKQIFFSLIQNHFEIIEAKSQDRQVMALKGELWKKITQQYNEIITSISPSYVCRDSEELKTFWKNIRRVHRRRTFPEGNAGPDASGCNSPAGPSSEMESFMSTMQVGQMPLSGGSDGQDSNGELDDSINIKVEPVLGASPEVSEEYDNTSLNIDRNASPSPPPSMTGPYLLKKETHSSTILDQLMRDESFTDVILTAEGQSIKAHKVVLCLASSYFRQVLKKESNVQSVVVFRDIKFEELKNLVNFMYTGEATVDASNLESFMRTAEMLEVTSLCDGQCSIPRSFLSKSIPEPEQNNRPNKRQRPQQRSSSIDKSDRVSTPPQKNKRVRKHSPSNEVNSKNTSGGSSTTNNISGIDSKVSIKSEPGEQDQSVACSPKDPSLSDLGEEENTVLTREKLVPGRCPFCPDSENYRQGPALTNHILISHPDKTAFVCDNCAKVFFIEGSYLAHMSDCFR